MAVLCKVCPPHLARHACHSGAVVFQDAEGEPASSDGAPKPTLRQRLDRGGGAPPEEVIMQDPLHLHKVGAGRLPAGLASPGPRRYCSAGAHSGWHM